VERTRSLEALHRCEVRHHAGLGRLAERQPRQRGDELRVKIRDDNLIAVVDGLKGLAEAIEVAFPSSTV